MTLSHLVDPGSKNALGSAQRTLAPGRYAVLVGEATIPGVEIAPRRDALLQVGALRVETDNRATYDILDDSNEVIARRKP